MSNMSKYYKELANQADDINDKNMYEKQSRKHALKAFKKRREDLGLKAYLERRAKRLAREEAAKESKDIEYKNMDGETITEYDEVATASIEDTKPKKKKVSKKKTKKKSTKE